MAVTEEPELEITIGKDGTVEFDKQKFTDDSCLGAFEDIMDALGKKVSEKKKYEASKKKDAKRVSVNKQGRK
jgi:hypothetical protein